MKLRFLILLIFLPLALGTDCYAVTKKQTYKAPLRRIAQDIAKLKSEFPQLQEFSLAKNVQTENLIIDYAFHTHRSHIPGGWRAHVPEPDDDGIWFYIDFHEPTSTAQIHTQPVMPEHFFRDKNVSVFILEGAKTKPFSERIWMILKNHGVTLRHKHSPASLTTPERYGADRRQLAKIIASWRLTRRVVFATSRE